MIKQNRINASSIVLATAADVMVTTMISIRILSIYRMTNAKDFSLIQIHANKYINVVTILVESAAPCAILGILFCVQEFMDASSHAPLFGLCVTAIGQTWSMSTVSCLLYEIKAKQLNHVLQMLFPQLIIYRVAQGSAWTEKTAQELTQATGSRLFAPGATQTATLGSEPNALTEGVHYLASQDDFAHQQATSV
jgi:hypothetical protein